mmetsp:Transcript_771/g.1591  ORF Transcript_771/g.1591 Transcript_771/m.1591 type:complete len:321 (+) Transcript_771:367-1329(+)
MAAQILWAAFAPRPQPVQRAQVRPPHSHGLPLGLGLPSAPMRSSLHGGIPTPRHAMPNPLRLAKVATRSGVPPSWSGLPRSVSMSMARGQPPGPSGQPWNTQGHASGTTVSCAGPDPPHHPRQGLPVTWAPAVVLHQGGRSRWGLGRRLRQAAPAAGGQRNPQSCMDSRLALSTALRGRSQKPAQPWRLWMGRVCQRLWRARVNRPCLQWPGRRRRGARHSALQRLPCGTSVQEPSSAAWIFSRNVSSSGWHWPRLLPAVGTTSWTPRSHLQFTLSGVQSQSGSGGQGPYPRQWQLPPPQGQGPPPTWGPRPPRLVLSAH